MTGAIAGGRAVTASLVDRPQRTNAVEHELPGLVMTDTTELAHADVARRIDAMRDRNRGVPIEGILQPEQAEDVLAALAGITALHLNEFQDEQKLLLEQLALAAVAWTLDEALEVTIGFERGVATRLDGTAMPGPEMLSRLNRAFGAYGVGRHIYTGDVTIGLKGRIVFECPGIDALLLAHQALEDTVNTRLQNQFRHQVAQRWAELVYSGFFYEPHKLDLEAYLASSQSAVTGRVTLRTEGGSLHAVAVESDYILQDESAVYAQSCDWTPEEAEGFIKLLGKSSTMAARVRGD